MDHNPSSLRKTICMQRQGLNWLEQSQSSRQLLKLFQLFFKNFHIEFSASLKIASYYSGRFHESFGEIGTLDLNLWLEDLGHQMFFPIIQEKPKPLLFGQWSCRKRLPKKNKYNIPEPPKKHSIQVNDCDLILTPLVAFDKQCHRMGMGGGFYDRTFANIKDFQKKPLLIGLAHEFQKVEALHPNPWDHPLDYVISNRAIYRRKHYC